MEPLSGRTPRDQNRAPALFAIDTTTGNTTVPLEANPATGALLVETVGGGGANVAITSPLGSTTAAASVSTVLSNDYASTGKFKLVDSAGTNVASVDGTGALSVNLTENTIGLATSANQTNGTQQTKIVDGNANQLANFTVPSVAQPFGIPVQILDASGNQITSFGGTQYTEGATTTPGSGILSLARYSSPTPVLTAGSMESLQLDSSGNLKVNVAVGGTSSGSGSTAVTSGDVSTIAGQPVNTVTPGTQLVSLTDELGDPLRSTTPGALDIAIANVAIDGSENLKTAPGAFEVANPFNSTEVGCALSVKTTQGYLLSILVTNYNAAKRYLHIISKPTAPAAGDTPTFSIPIPAGNSVQPAYVSVGQELFGQGGCYLQFGVAVGVSTTANVFNQASSADHTLAGLYV